MSRFKDWAERSFAVHVLQRWTVDLVVDGWRWAKEHKTMLFYVGLGGWVIYWLFIGDTGHACANTPTWLEIAFWAVLGGMLLFMVYLMWQMRGFPKRLYRYDEKDQATVREAAAILGSLVSDFHAQRIARELPTFTRGERDTLDDLNVKFPVGLRIAFQAGDHRRIATVVGYCYSLPKVAGGPNEPALVGDSFDAGLVNVYPDEVIAQDPLNR